MFTELAVIDWIALAFASVLLAAACAAGVIAYATSSSRPEALPSILKGRTSAHAAKTAMNGQPPTTSGSTADRVVLLQPPVVPESHQHDSSESEPTAHVMASVDADQRLAERAARLRGRPVPEARPSAEPQTVNQTESQTLRHKAMIQSVISNRTPAHAKTFSSAGLESGVASSNYDRAEGFKARTPGFFDDPMGRHELRYWDGHTWTEYVKEHGERFTDPL